MQRRNFIKFLALVPITTVALADRVQPPMTPRLQPSSLNNQQLVEVNVGYLDYDPKTHKLTHYRYIPQNVNARVRF